MTPNRRLKQARELRGWSQAKVAEIISTDATTVSRWERGLFSPTPYFRERLCLLFNKNAEELGLLDVAEAAREEIPGIRSPRLEMAPGLQQEHKDQRNVERQSGTITRPASSWPRRDDTFGYILDSAAHDQQAYTLWEDAYVRVMRGQLAEARQLGEASLNAFEHMGHPNAEVIRKWLEKNQLIPPASPSTHIPSVPLALLPRKSKRTIKHILRRLNIGLLFIVLASTTLGLVGFAFNQSLIPGVQAGILASPVAQKQAPAQITVKAATMPALRATPASIPTARSTDNAQTPVANSSGGLNLFVTPSSLTPTNCQPDSGYRCTLRVTLYSSEQNDLSWQASSTSLPVQFNPPAGNGRSGNVFEVIVYIQSAPGQNCQLVFILKSSTYTIKTSVPWKN